MPVQLCKQSVTFNLLKGAGFMSNKVIQNTSFNPAESIKVIVKNHHSKLEKLHTESQDLTFCFSLNTSYLLDGLWIIFTTERV